MFPQNTFCHSNPRTWLSFLFPALSYNPSRLQRHRYNLHHGKNRRVTRLPDELPQGPDLKPWGISCGPPHPFQHQQVSRGSVPSYSGTPLLWCSVHRRQAGERPAPKMHHRHPVDSVSIRCTLLPNLTNLAIFLMDSSSLQSQQTTYNLHQLEE